MIKVRLWGESAEIEDMIEQICNNLPNVRVLSVSGHYKDRGASVYERCYLDVELHGGQPAGERSDKNTEIAGIKQ